MSEPLVPVTLTVYVPVLVPEGTVIFSVDEKLGVPEEGVSVTVQPLGYEADSVTGFPNPLSGVTFIVELPEEPALIVKVEGDAEREKSGVGTVTVTVVECVSEPLEPVTVTVYNPGAVPDGTGIDSVDEADPPDETVSEVGLRLTIQPTGALVISETVPLNPLREVAVIVELPEVPAWTVKEDGEAETEKSGVVV